LATSVTGTLAVANGGTGATTLTGLIKGSGTSALTAASAGTDYLAPNGSAAALTNFPTLNQNTTGTAANVSGTVAVLNGGTGATTAAAALTNLGAAPIASPTFTGSVTAPIYASTPQALTAGSTINWNPANGLNASVTLNQNSTLNFTSTPTAGSYGTLIVTQDATGSRTITLPSTANKVLGSTSTTTITLSTAANAKDILNFYYDGTNCYWNIGQGYGTAAAASTTNLATSVSGTLAVANGGTGAATLTGYVKGTGTTAMTASASIPVADVTGAAPLASPTFSGTPSLPTGTTGVTQTAGNNTTALATTAFVTSAVAAVASTVRLNSDEFTATAAQTTFTFTTATSNTGAVQTPLSKPYMFINGTRIKNSAYTWTSGTTVTYIPANNNSYALVVGDRIQFDYAY
jgi:hypothetical protein